MPKVTLLAEAWANYTLIFGKREYTFAGGVGVEVPPAVALACKKRVDRKKKPLFKVEGLGGLVVSPAPRSAKQNVVAVDESLGTINQRRLIGAEICH